MHSPSRHDAERVARLLRNHEDRLQNVEETIKQDAIARPFRRVEDRRLASDTVTTTVDSSPILVLDSGSLDYKQLAE